MRLQLRTRSRWIPILIFILTVGITGSSTTGYANSPEYLPGFIVVKFKPQALVANELRAQSLADPFFPSWASLQTSRMFPHKGSDQIARGIGLDRIYLYKFDDNVDVEQMAAQLRALPGVDYAEPDRILRMASFTPDDSLYSNLWHLNNTGQTGGNPDADIDAPEAWMITTGNDSIVIAILDTGVDLDHGDLAAQLWVNPGEDLNMNDVADWDSVSNGGDLDWIDNDGSCTNIPNVLGTGISLCIDDLVGFDFVTAGGCEIGEDCTTLDNDPDDFDGHGTHCAGIAVADGNNGSGVPGVCFDCRLMVGRVCWREAGANGSSCSLLRGGWAIVYATDNGADVISMSYGGLSLNPFEQDAVQYAFANGVVLVAASGNSPTTPPGSFLYPAAHPEVIAVAATDHNDLKASFTNYASYIDISAPGVNILSTTIVGLSGGSCRNSSGYGYCSGTSMSTPMVAGVAGLILSVNPDLTPTEVRDILKQTSDSIDSLQSPGACGGVDCDGLLGAGRLNAYQAVLAASPNVAVGDVPSSRSGPRIMPVNPNPSVSGVAIHFVLPTGGAADLLVYDVSGRIIQHLASGVFSPGQHRVEWDGRDATGQKAKSGVYYLRLSTTQGEDRKAIVRVR